jgi:small subunit ribosomal protein S16
MPVKIRLARRGRRKAPFYHIVVADARAPRDGKFIEQIGKYNPLTKPATIELDRDRAFDWIMKGAQPTETARAILRFKGVLYRKHLARGVAKGALDQDKADQLYNDYVEAKEAKIAERFAESKQQQLDFYKMVSGTPKAVAVTHTAADAEAEAFQSVEVSEDSEAAAPVADAPATEESAPEPKAEEAAPEAKAEEAAPEAKAEEAPEPKAEEAPEAKSAEAAPEAKAEEAPEAKAEEAPEAKAEEAPEAKAEEE